jgi:hypothetical protein
MNKVYAGIFYLIGILLYEQVEIQILNTSFIHFSHIDI